MISVCNQKIQEQSHNGLNRMNGKPSFARILVTILIIARRMLPQEINRVRIILRGSHQDRDTDDAIRVDYDMSRSGRFLAYTCDSTIRVPHRSDEPHLGRQQGKLGWKGQSGLEETAFTGREKRSVKKTRPCPETGEIFTRACQAAFRGDQRCDMGGRCHRNDSPDDHDFPFI